MRWLRWRSVNPLLDNITHSLAGLLLAEAFMQLRSRRGNPPSASWRSAAYVVSVAGNNLPDLDFLVTGLTMRPLGYLLHHRGHSHTVVVALALAGLSLLIARAATQARKIVFSRSDWRWLIGLAVLGPIVHIAMDASNNYGVHPFWPFYDGWIYGDAVFIVEPFFWAVTIPPLWFCARARLTRAVLGTVLLLGVGATWFVRFIPAPLALAVTAVAAGAGLIAWRVRPARRVAVGIVGSWTIAAIFGMASGIAKSVIARAPAASDARILDIVATPFPANPLCYSVLVIQERGGDYLVRRATVATLPTWVPSAWCPHDPDEEPTASFEALPFPDTGAIRWRGQFVARAAELGSLAQDNCQAAAFLRFARAPYFVRESSDTYVMGDLRYDRRPGLDFSDLRVPERPVVCPRHVPPWIPPRSDLLPAL